MRNASIAAINAIAKTITSSSVVPSSYPCGGWDVADGDITLVVGEDGAPCAMNADPEYWMGTELLATIEALAPDDDDRRDALALIEGAAIDAVEVSGVLPSLSVREQERRELEAEDARLLAEADEETAEDLAALGYSVA